MSSKHLPLRQSGFTLVELMVGMTIGLLVAVIILQVLSVFEAQKRTTTGTADAQTNGSIALFNIGRELQQGGYPLVPITNPALKCTAVTVGGIADTISRLSPVTLTDGTSDSLTVRYGDSLMGGVPTQTAALPSGSLSTAAPARDVTVLNNFGCSTSSDVLLISSGSNCALSSGFATSGTTSTITFADATDADTLTTAAIIAAPPGVTNIACLGSWHEVSYRVNAGNLERQDGIASAFVANVAGIVNIQAQYGISAAANSNQVIQWVDPSGGTWAAPTTANRNLIKAIRIAVVARNAKMEAGNVSSVCSSTTASSPTGLCAWAGNAVSPAPAIDLSADANWRRYRYRVFETILPLRNMIWSKDTL